MLTLTRCCIPGLPLIIHLKIPWLFPDFSLTFYSFPYPLTVKKSFLFFTLMVLTVSLQIWGYSERKEFAPSGSKFFPLRVAPNEEGDGLRLSMRKYILSPFEHKFSEDCLPWPFIFQIPWLSKSFLNFPGHPQNSLTFSWPGKNSFSRYFPWPWQPWHSEASGLGLHCLHMSPK